MKLDSKAGKRSPYAKSLEQKQYRHRVQEHKRIDIDDWIEDALEEYWREKNEAAEIQRKKAEKNQDNRQRETKDSNNNDGESSTLVESTEQEPKGCFSHSCRVKKPDGMATNSPCKCPKEHWRF